jgi:hypothetical protein
MLDLAVFTDEQISTAYERVIALLDMRVLPDPLQDDVYIFSAQLTREMTKRRKLKVWAEK